MLANLRKQPVDILLWANGPIDHALADGCVYFHEHAFNCGQHVAHNEMLDECVRRGYDWHIRIDDDCFINSRTWTRKLLGMQEHIKEIRGKYAVLGINVGGLYDPPQAIRAFEVAPGKTDGGIFELVEMLGGIFRMSPMYLMRYFRWDERQAMGFGDATQFRSFCESTDTIMFRIRTIHATHGESTQKQNEKSPDWSHSHDMLQYIPLGL